MDPSRRRPSFLFSLLFPFLAAAAVVRGSSASSSGAGVFEVKRKFSAGSHSIADLKNHDANRHARLLSSTPIDLPLGGNGLPTSTGLYFTEIGLGTPQKKFTVQVDTGSDVLWVNCAPCEGCKKSMDHGDKTIYDPKDSKTVKKLGCDEPFCKAVYTGGEGPECHPGGNCTFQLKYGDGSKVSGYFVTDVLNYNQVSGDHQTKPASSNVTFGCGDDQTGMSSVVIEGLIGFGQAKSSMISQLGSSGKVRKIFAHCLDTVKGGGIFAIGNVVEPKVKMTPLVPYMQHYNVNLTSIEIGGKGVRLPLSMFQTRDDSGTIIDSGTTLAYLPDIAYKEFMEQIFSGHSDLNKSTIDDNFTCFSFSGSLNDAFPVVTFNFEMSVTLQVHPQDYFFKNKDLYCIGWQNGGEKYTFLLGDITFSNKLVIYDLENQTIGWTDYNCASSIKIEDDTSKAATGVDAHNLPSAARKLEIGISMLLLPLALLLHLLFKPTH